MLDVLRVVISKAEELLQFFNRGWFRPGTNSLNLVGVRAQTTSFDNMPQVLNQLLTKKSLLMFGKQLFPYAIFQTQHANPTCAIQWWD